MHRWGFLTVGGEEYGICWYAYNCLYLVYSKYTKYGV